MLVNYGVNDNVEFYNVHFEHINLYYNNMKCIPRHRTGALVCRVRIVAPE